MLLKYFKVLLLGLFLLVSGCFQIFPCGRFQVFPCESEISIDQLPEAIVGKPYFAKIEIWGGTMIDEDNIKWEITPEQTWLNIKIFQDKGGHYNGSPIYRGVELYGTPETQENIIFRLYGKSSRPCICSFDKTFILKVNPAEQELPSD